MTSGPTAQPVRPARRTRHAVSLVVAILLAAAAWFVVGRASAETSLRASSAGESVIEQFPVENRQAVDPFTARLLDGDSFDSTASGAPVTVFNVWGSWCGPCRVETPDLKRAAEATAGRAAFVGVNVRDGLDAALAFERANEVPYPSIRAEDSAAALLSFGTSLGVTAVPTTLVLDQQGRIAARVVGPTTYATLVALIDDILVDGVAPGRPAAS